MIDDTLFNERVALPAAQSFGELAGGNLVSQLTVKVDEGADFFP